MSKKILLVSGLIILLAGFFVYEKFVANQQNPTPIINNNQNQASGNSPPPNSVPTTQTTTGFKDGNYTGAETSSIYGKAKVEIIVLSGRVTDVQFLEYPNGRTASVQKSNMAMPIIKQEVIQAQSANVNTVSGATQTSDSFIQSIASALSKAS